MLCLKKHLYLENRGSVWAGREGRAAGDEIVSNRERGRRQERWGDGTTWELMDGKMRVSHDL